MVSIFLHWLASEGCQSISSVLLRACSKCQLISSESLGFENKRFKRAIIGRYHMTMARIFLFFLALEAVSSTSAESSSSSRSSLRLYRLLLHNGHLSYCSYSFRYRMQWFGHACIFCTSKANGAISFFARQVLHGNLFGFGSMSLKRTKRSMKLLLDHPFLAFSFKSSSTECNNVNLPSQPIILSYKSSSLALFNPSKLSRPPLVCS